MTKSLLEEIQENAQFVARCPACSQSPRLADTMANQMGPGNNGVHKRGRFEGERRSAMPVCKFCQGEGIVFLNRICECAMPAILWHLKKKLWYCGSSLCADSAAWRRDSPNYGHFGGM